MALNPFQQITAPNQKIMIFKQFQTPLAVTIVTLMLAAQSLHAQSPAKSISSKGQGVVKVEKRGGAFFLTRDGSPFYVKGVGGSAHFEEAAAVGANSIRTWGIDKAEATLKTAEKLGLTVTLGIWLDHSAARYNDEAYKARIREEFRRAVQVARKSPALLCYALGNETNSGADTEQAWRFINELAEIAKQEDPNHPTMTVLAGSSVKTINNVAQFAPAIDILGVNTYRGIVNAPRDVAASNFKGPYIVTEWGPYGHWEVGKNPWGVPLEQTSDEKAAAYQSSYEMLLKDDKRCLGSYVFLWGQKQERTPTWYGMFLEKNNSLGLGEETTAAADVMIRFWTGKEPSNRAPSIQAIKVGNGTRDRYTTVKPDEELVVSVEAKDPDGDQLRYVWEVLAEATVLGQGGSHEPRPSTIAGAVRPGMSEGSATVKIGKAGNYRVYGYVLDGKGKAGTFNIPIQVK